MSENKENVPKLRFPGFTDPWEQRKFSEVAERRSMSSSNLELPCVEYEDIVSGEGVLNKDVTKKNDKRSGIVFEPDDVLYGKLRPYLRNWLNPQFKGIALGDFWVLKPIDLDSKFLFNLIQSPGFECVANESTGTKMPRADWKNVSDTEFMIPYSADEQRLIGTFFQSLSTLITLHQRKLSHLQELKKGLLQKMFPKEGETVPELRFPGFTDPWEQRKLKELTTESKEYATISSGLPLLTSSRIGLMYQTEYRDSVTTDNQETLFSVVPLNACTYRHMSDDNVFHLNINALEKGLVSREYPVFTASGDNDLMFIVQHLNSGLDFRAFCTEQKKGGTRTRLYYKTLCDFSFLVPESNEQKKISELLQLFDSLITLHQRKLSHLQELKKGLLQQMFV